MWWSVLWLQVAVLGLPWEYTAADVRALIEAAAEADGTRAAEAGVEAVEVAYRDDGKSEVGINMPGRLGVLYGMSYSPPSWGFSSSNHSASTC
jgi:hypothetical protein